MPHAHAASQFVRSFAWLEHVGPNSDLLHAIAGAALRLPNEPLGQSTAPALVSDGAEVLSPSFPWHHKVWIPLLPDIASHQGLLGTDSGWGGSEVPFESSKQIVPGGSESSVPNNWPTCAGIQSCAWEWIKMDMEWILCICGTSANVKRCQ